MTTILPPEREAARLDSLNQANILDTPPEPEFDDLTLLAAAICQTPIALVTLIDRDRQWFKSKVGVEAEETRREHAFCQHAIGGDQILIVPDAAADKRFSENPFVAGESGVRFYAGAPLVGADGHALGTLCVLDRKPRELSAEQIAALKVLAGSAIAQIELRRKFAELKTTISAKEQAEKELQQSQTDYAGLFRGRRVETRRLTALYSIALTSVALLALLSYALIERALLKETADARLVNVAGRQRMLSQRLTKAALAAQNGGTPEEKRLLLAEAEQALTEWESAHRALQNGDAALELDGDNSPEIKALFARLEPHFLEMQIAAGRIVRGATDEQAARGAITSLLAAESRFLPIMEIIVGQFEREARGRVNYVLQLETVSLALLLLVLVAEGLFIFRPATRRISRTITELLDVQNRLSRSEERYRELVDSSLGLICTHDLDGKLLSVNPAAARSLGYAPAEMIGRCLKDFLAPRAKKFYADYLRQMRKQGAYSGLMHVRTKTGADRIWMCSNIYLEEADKAPYILGHAQDVTEPKRAEHELRQTLQRLKFHVENSPIAVVEWNKNLEVIGWSPGAERIFGWRAAEVTGKKIDADFRFMHEADRARINEIVIGELFSGDKQRNHYLNRNYTKNGSVVWCEWFNSALVNERGELVSVMSLALDVTERQQMEDELETARDQALESVRLKSEFLANMSHEIRTPMNGVIGMNELLLDTALTGEQRKFAAAIKTSGENLLRIINDILDFSKIEAGKLDFEMLDFDLRGAVENTVEMFADAAREQQNELISFVSPDVPSALKGDAGRLRQVLTNLIGNAVKFTKRGKVVVRTAAERETDHFVRLRFTVTDTGVGISEESQSKLFQSFSQADASTTRRFGGTGLGLVISQRLVEMMNGEIGFESKLGAGSTFWFTAEFEKQSAATASPLIAAGANPKNACEISNGNLHKNLNGNRLDLQILRVDDNIINAEVLSAPHHARRRILVVEDNPINQTVAKNQLENLGYHADIAANGFEALEAIGKMLYDLVLMDCQMPEMDGYEATAAIRAQEEKSRAAETAEPAAESSANLRSRLPVIAMTAHAIDGERERCLAAGMDDYISKPVNKQMLRETIERWVETNPRQPVPDQAAESNSSELLSPENDLQSTAEPGGEPPVDRRTLEDLTLGDSELLCEIINIYLEQTELQLTEMRRAIAEQDADALYLVAHKAVGGSATCGMRAVVPPFRELEQMSKKRCFDNAEIALANAAEAFAEVSRQCREIAAEKTQDADCYEAHLITQ